MFRQYHLLLIFSLFSIAAFGQTDSSSWAQKLKAWKIKPIIGIQLWTSYTFGQQIYNQEKEDYQAVDNRLNFQIRRSRLGIKGQPYPNLSFNLVGAFDLVGRDILSGTEAGANNGASPRFRLWNAFLKFKASKTSEKLNFTLGYFVPQIGRASISSAFRSSSLEKSWSQNYLRRHLVGIGPGRAVGINMGGLFLSPQSHFSWRYDIGIHNPSLYSFNNNSVGAQYAPLFTGRLAIYLGDPASTKYSIGHRSHFFDQRKGLSLAIAAASQGQTDLFQSNTALGFDFLLHWQQLNFDGEWTLLQRNGQLAEDNLNREITVKNNTGYFRIAYNLPTKNNAYFVPTIMLVGFNGALDAKSQTEAALLNSFSGRESILEFGCSYYPNPDLKFSLHYTLRQGVEGDAGDGSTINNYFFQNDLGPIQRGDWLGAGVMAIF